MIFWQRLAAGVRPQPSRRRRTIARVGISVVGLLAAGSLLTGCGAADPADGPSASPGNAPSSIAAPSLSARPSVSPTPPDPSPAVQLGPTLRELGFQNGPLDDFSLPKGALAVAQVDQPNTVTFVLTQPSPEAVESYLRTTLVKNGFTINARADIGQAMTFSGHGWTGAFTGTNSTSAIVLRPAAPR